MNCSFESIPEEFDDKWPFFMIHLFRERYIDRLLFHDADKKIQGQFLTERDHYNEEMVGKEG